MASANVKEFSQTNFDAEVLRSPVPVLVDFWAEWCQPCRMLTPAIEAVADEFSGKVKVGKVDIDNGDNQAISIKYGISAIPTLILFKDGEIKKKFVGLTTKDDLSKAMNEVAGR